MENDVEEIIKERIRHVRPAADEEESSRRIRYEDQDDRWQVEQPVDGTDDEDVFC